MAVLSAAPKGAYCHYYLNFYKQSRSHAAVILGYPFNIEQQVKVAPSISDSWNYLNRVNHSNRAY